MIGLLLLLALGDATEIRLDRDGWAMARESEEPPLAPGESTWRWTDRCAPQKLQAGSPVECKPVREVNATVIDAAGEPVAAVPVIWATKAMLADLPDAMLPRGVTREDGTVAVRTSQEPVYVRAAGPAYASAWRLVAGGASGVRLQVSRAARASVRLVADDGKPVIRARVALVPPAQSAIGADRILAFVDGAGAAQLHPPERSPSRLIVWSDSHAPVSRLLTLDRDDVTVTLDAGASLRVRLRDADRNPVADGVLDVQYALPGMRMAIRRSTAARPDGSASLRGLPAAAAEWSASAPGFARRVASLTLRAGDNDAGEVTLVRARNVRVTVTDAARQPVAGARVVTGDSSTGTTQPDGSVVLAGIPVEDVRAEISAPGFLREVVQVERDATHAAVTLRRGAGVKAVLVPEGDGTSPSSVRARITNNGAESVRLLESGENVLISGLAAGTIRVRLSAEGCQTFDSGPMEVEENAIRDLGLVILKRGLGVRGRVVDERGTALADARVRVLRLDGDSPALANVMGDWTETTVRPDGSFELTSLRAGSQLLVIEAAGHAMRVLDQLRLDDADRDVDLGEIRMTRGTAVRILCRPAKRCGASAELLPAGPDFPFLALHSSMQQGAAQLESTPEGRATLRLLQGRQVVHEREIDVRRRVDVQTVEIELPSIRVDGVVTVGRTPARGGTVVLRSVVKGGGLPILFGSRTENGSELAREWIGSFGGIARADVDSKGAFVFEEIADGDYDATYRLDGSETREIRVTVANTPKQTLRLDFEGHVVAGRIVDVDDRPVVAAVEVKDSAGAVHGATSGTDGAFSILGVGSGAATVTARAGRRSATHEVDAGTAAARAVRLRLDRDRESLSITVTESDGSPASGALVFAFADGRVHVASADSEGVAAFSALDAGTAAIAAAHRPGRDWGFGAGARVAFSDRNGSVTLGSSVAGRLGIVAPGGFPLDQVLAMTGVVPQVSAGGSVTLSGLPEGTYAVAAGAKARSVTVRAGEVSRVEFE